MRNDPSANVSLPIISQEQAHIKKNCVLSKKRLKYNRSKYNHSKDHE